MITDFLLTQIQETGEGILYVRNGDTPEFVSREEVASLLVAEIEQILCLKLEITQSRRGAYWVRVAPNAPNSWDDAEEWEPND